MLHRVHKRECLTQLKPISLWLSYQQLHSSDKQPLQKITRRTYTRKTLSLSHPAIAFDGFHECRERVRFQHDAVRMISDEVEIFQRRTGLGAFTTRRSSLVGAALQVILLMVADRRRQQVVHHDEPNVLPTTLYTTTCGQELTDWAKVLHHTRHWIGHRFFPANLLP